MNERAEVAKDLKILIQDKKYNEAKTIAEAALKGPHQQALLDSTMLLFRQLGDHETSLRLARDWISRNPNDWRGYFHSVQALVATQSFTEAASIIEIGLERHPQNKKLLSAACTVYRALGDHKISLGFSMGLIETDPESDLGYVFACEDLATLDMTDEAERVLEKASARGISSYKILCVSASLSVRKEDYPKVLSIARHMVANFPDKYDGYAIMAEALIALHDYNLAISCLASLDSHRTDMILVRLAKNPALDDVQTILLLRIILRRMEQGSQARTLLGTSLTGNGFLRTNSNRCSQVYAHICKLKHLMSSETRLCFGLEDYPKELVERLVHNDEKQLLGVLGSDLFNRPNRQALKEYLSSSNPNNDTLILRFYRKIFFPVAQIKATAFPRLKIAVCLSGQLRGYKKAIKTWSNLFTDDHDFQFFCSTWDQIGNKKLNPQHANRLLPERFVPVFRDAWFASSNPQRDLEPLLCFFEINTGVDANDLRSLYLTDHVEVVPSNDYCGRNNPYCMHMLIERAFRLIPDPTAFDLIFRFRFDRSVLASALDWHSLFDTCNTSNALFSNGTYITGLYPGVADQVAISNPRIMELYSTTFSAAQNNLYPFEDFNGKYTGHKTLGLNLLANDVNVIRIQGVEWGSLETVVPDDEKAIFQALSECKIHPAVLEKYSSLFQEL